MNLNKYKSGIFALLVLLSASCNSTKPLFTFRGEDVAPARVQFENISTNAESFEWEFGDGDTSSMVSPEHRFMGSGDFVVKLKAYKKAGKKPKILEQVIKIDAPQRCLAEIQTEFGNMIVLLHDGTPEHRDNFLKLSEEGFYNDLIFHRVIDGFMIQGGDPASKDAKPGQALGSGGPGYTIPAEFVDTLRHTKGALAAARRGDSANPQKRSSGSQFYIVQGREVDDRSLSQIEGSNKIRYSTEQRNLYKEIGGTPFLDGNYTVFGQIIEGIEVIDKIAKVKTDGRDRPVEDVKMKIRVIK